MKHRRYIWLLPLPMDWVVLVKGGGGKMCAARQLINCQQLGQRRCTKGEEKNHNDLMRFGIWKGAIPGQCYILERVETSPFPFVLFYVGHLADLFGWKGGSKSNRSINYRNLALLSTRRNNTLHAIHWYRAFYTFLPSLDMSKCEFWDCFVFLIL